MSRMTPAAKRIALLEAQVAQLQADLAGADHLSFGLEAALTALYNAILDAPPSAEGNPAVVQHLRQWLQATRMLLEAISPPFEEE